MGPLSKLRLSMSRPAASPDNAVPVQPVPIQPIQQAPLFNSTHFKMKLKQAKIRGDVQKVKARNTQMQTRATVVEELKKNRNATAYIRMEQLLRDSNATEAYDIFEVYVELLATRHTVIESNPDFSNLGSDMREAIASLAFASNRMNIAELRDVVTQLRTFYGPQIIDPLTRCEGPDAALVNPLLAEKLDGATPDGYDILEGLTAIAKEEGIAWVPPPEPEKLRTNQGTVPGPTGPVEFTPPFMPSNIPGPSVPVVQTFAPPPGPYGMPPPPPGPGGAMPHMPSPHFGGAGGFDTTSLSPPPGYPGAGHSAFPPPPSNFPGVDDGGWPGLDGPNYKGPPGAGGGGGVAPP